MRHHARIDDREVAPAEPEIAEQAPQRADEPEEFLEQEDDVVQVYPPPPELLEEPLHAPKPPIWSEMTPEQDCPMDLRGATISSEPIEGGMALVFRSVVAPLTELRERAATFASGYGELTLAALKGVAEGTEPKPSGAAATESEPLRVQIDLIRNGARIAIRVPDVEGAASEVPLLRSILRRHADWMAETRQCPMIRAGVPPSL